MYNPTNCLALIKYAAFLKEHPRCSLNRDKILDRMMEDAEDDIEDWKARMRLSTIGLDDDIRVWFN